MMKPVKIMRVVDVSELFHRFADMVAAKNKEGVLQVLDPNFANLRKLVQIVRTYGLGVLGVDPSDDLGQRRLGG